MGLRIWLVVAAAVLLLGAFQWRILGCSVGLARTGISNTELLGANEPPPNDCVEVNAASGSQLEEPGGAILVQVPDEGREPFGYRVEPGLAAEDTVLCGRLVHASDGQAVAGGGVFWLANGKAPVSAWSEADGSFCLAVELGEAGELVAKQEGMLATRLALGPLTSSRQDLLLGLSEPATLIGRVTLGAHPTSDVRVLIVHSPGVLCTAPVDSNGSYRMEGLPAGDVIVRAFEGELSSYMRSELPWISSGLEPWPGRDVELSPGKVSKLDVALVPQMQGSLIREVDLGLKSGIRQVTAVLSIRDLGDTGELRSQRRETPVSEDGFAKFEWAGLEIGTYELVLSTTDAPIVVLHREQIQVDGEMVKPPILPLETGGFVLDVCCQNVGPWLVTIEQKRQAAIHFRTEERSLEVRGVPLGEAKVTLSHGALVVSTGIVSIGRKHPSRYLRLE